MDRRIRKTREAIFEAFVGLLAEKDFEQITINDIADRADVSRGTVYLHYTDKFDLLDQCVELHLARLLESCVDSDHPDFPSKASLIRAFEYLAGNPFFHHALQVNKGVPAFRNRLMVVLSASLNAQITRSGIDHGMNQAVVVQFLASAIAGTVEWWVTQSMPCAPEDVAQDMWTLLESLQSAAPATR